MFSLTDIIETVNSIDKAEEKTVKIEIEDFLKLTLKNCNKEQMDIINSTCNEYIVHGPAGSGKSLIAMRRAMQLMDENKDMKIIIYTKALSEYLKGRLKKANLRNIAEFIITGENYSKVLDDGVDYVIVDEVQDFSMNEVDIIMSKAKKGRYLFGDDGQQIYPKRTGREQIIKRLIEEGKLANYKLINTYRFPKQIALFCECLKENEKGLSDRCVLKGTSDNTPKIIEFKEADDEINYICKTIINEGWKDVGILVENNDMVDIYYKKMKDKGIICDYKNKKIEDLDFSNDNPKIITYHSSKGLEFERVFIPNCSTGERKDAGEFNYKEALFVACTRASKTLVISYITGKKSKYLDVIKDSLYKFEKR